MEALGQDLSVLLLTPKYYAGGKDASTTMDTVEQTVMQDEGGRTLKSTSRKKDLREKLCMITCSLQGRLAPMMLQDLIYRVY